MDSPDNGLREYIQRQELKRERIRNASNPKFNNLAIYDNLNEFNDYLNAKLMDRHHSLKKGAFKDAESVLSQTNNRFNSESKLFFLRISIYRRGSLSENK